MSNLAEPPQSIDQYHYQITALQHHGFTQYQLLEWLRAEGVDISERTLRRRLAQWAIRKCTTASDDVVIPHVFALSHYTSLTDSDIATQIYLKHRIQTTENQVRKLRKRVDRSKRRTGEQKAFHQEQTYNLVRHLILAYGRDFGRRWAKISLRNKIGYHARHDDIAAAMKQIDPKGVAARIPGGRIKRKDNYTTSGANHIWCLDGHDKLSQFGMEIYAAIDAYSRKIIWFYCGNSNRTQCSVVHQYLATIKRIGICPSFLRTDRGTETSLLAAAHFSLYRKHCLLTQPVADEESEIRIERCYIYGPSTRNVRIESKWATLGRKVTHSWTAYFRSLANSGLYDQHVDADKIALLFVFMPIIRTELQQFVEDCNEYPIRPQPKRSHHVAGTPNELYSRSAHSACSQYGFKPDSNEIYCIEACVGFYGETMQCFLHESPR